MTKLGLVETILPLASGLLSMFLSFLSGSSEILHLTIPKVSGASVSNVQDQVGAVSGDVIAVVWHSNDITFCRPDERDL